MAIRKTLAEAVAEAAKGDMTLICANEEVRRRVEDMAKRLGVQVKILMDPAPDEKAGNHAFLVRDEDMRIAFKPLPVEYVEGAKAHMDSTNFMLRYLGIPPDYFRPTPPNVRWGYAIARTQDDFRRALGPHWRMWQYEPTGNVRGLADTTLLMIGQYWRNKAVDENMLRMTQYCHDRNIRQVRMSDQWEDNKSLFAEDGRLQPPTEGV